MLNSFSDNFKNRVNYWELFCALARLAFSSLGNLLGRVCPIIGHPRTYSPPPPYGIISLAFSSLGNLLGRVCPIIGHPRTYSPPLPMV